MKAVWTLATCLMTCSLAYGDIAPTEEPRVDLSQYSGIWYEIASLPQPYQADCVSDVKAEYTLLEDNTVKVVNSCVLESGELKVAEGRAQVAEEGVTNSLIVSFTADPEANQDELSAWDFTDAGQYVILDVASDYSYALVGHPERSAGWILSRTPAISAELLAKLEGKMLREGYDTCQLMTSVQSGGMTEVVPLCQATSATPTLIDVLEAKGEFNQLLGAIEAAGLVTTLKADGPFTIFAPTDAAFEKLPVEAREALLQDIDALTAVLLGHVMIGDFKAETLMSKTDGVSLLGSNFIFTIENEMMYVNGAQVLMADVPAQNGTIHVIDTVLIMEKECGDDDHGDDDGATDDGGDDDETGDDDGADDGTGDDEDDQT